MRKTPLLRLMVAAAVPALLLAGCTSSADDDPTEPTETAQAPTPVATPTATESPDTSADEGGDLDEQDGVRTNSFNAMPDQLGEMRLRSTESDPSTHMAQREYLAADEQSRLIIMFYIPGAEGGGHAPVSSSSDPGFRSAVDSARRHFEDQGLELIERTATTGAHEWECFEALQTQTGNIDHSFCLTTDYGRVIDLQRLALHDPDEQARNTDMDILLNEVSTALAEIGS